MTDVDATGYAEGVRAADKAIDAGYPRWIDTNSNGFGSLIDQGTGLPVDGLSGPPNLRDWNESFAKGFNDEILAAVNSGAIDVDFRPLLMTFDEVEESLASNCLGTLSDDNSRISAPDGNFVIEIQNDKRKKSSRIRWVEYRLSDGQEWPKFSNYEGPMRVALGKEGRVLVFESVHVYSTRDVKTTQALNRYLKRR